MKKYFSKIIIARGVALGIFLIFSFSSNCALAKDITPENIIDLANYEREKSGLKPLFFNANLLQVAESKARDMLANNYFAHTSPQGKVPWFWFENSGYDYKYAGENLAMGFSEAGKTHQAWMNSATHRQNILNAHYQEIGVAVVRGTVNNRNAIVVVQEFGARSNFVIPENVMGSEVIKISKNEVISEAKKEIKQSIVVIDWNKVLNIGVMLIFCIAIIANTTIMAYVSLNYFNVINARRSVY